MELVSIETQIIKAVISALLAAGFEVSVMDGEETTVVRSADPELILAAMRTTDEDHLIAYPVGGTAHGWVLFIYGNDDVEVINDYTVNLEPVMRDVFAMIDKYTSR